MIDYFAHCGVVRTIIYVYYLENFIVNIFSYIFSSNKFIHKSIHMEEPNYVYGRIWPIVPQDALVHKGYITNMSL